MSVQEKYRQDLPQLKDGEKPFLVDGGLETHLVYHQGNLLGYGSQARSPRYAFVRPVRISKTELIVNFCQI